MLAVGILAAARLLQAPAARADSATDLFDCTTDVGDPVSGSLSWDLADQNNRWCASEGQRTAAANPAFYAAAVANAVEGSVDPGDPFRAIVRWAGVRGAYLDVGWTDRDGQTHPGALFGPLDANGGPYPGVLVVCHVCSGTTGPEGVVAYRWINEVLAEHGYVVFFPDVGGGSIDRTIDATDYFVSTQQNPSAHNSAEYNPWWERLDASRLGIAGHSGAGFVALNVGNLDDRYDAIVAFDPASGPAADVTLGTPTLIEVADYPLARIIHERDSCA